MQTNNQLVLTEIAGDLLEMATGGKAIKKDDLLFYSFEIRRVIQDLMDKGGEQ